MPFDGTNSTPETVIYLMDALEILSRRGGWMKGQLNNARHTSFCAMGVVRFVTHDHETCSNILHDYIYPEIPAAHRRLIFNFQDVCNTIIDYNDMPSRRKHQILALFNRAIERAMNDTTQQLAHERRCAAGGNPAPEPAPREPVSAG